MTSCTIESTMNVHMAIMSQASGERGFIPTIMASALRIAPRSARIATPAAHTQASPHAPAIRANGLSSSFPERMIALATNCEPAPKPTKKAKTAIIRPQRNTLVMFDPASKPPVNCTIQAMRPTTRRIIPTRAILRVDLSMISPPYAVLERWGRPV